MAETQRRGSYSIENDKTQWLKDKKKETGLSESYFVNKGLDIVQGVEQVNLINAAIIPAFSFILSFILFIFGIVFSDALPLSVLLLILISSMAILALSSIGLIKVLKLYEKNRGLKMKKKETENKKASHNGLKMSALIIGIIVTLVLTANINPTEIMESGFKRGWQNLGWAATGEGPIPAGESGFCYFMTVPHQANGWTAFASNYTNASAYEYKYYMNQELTGETPYNTAHDYLLKMRVNTTVGYNTSSSTWMDSWVRAFIEINFDFTADVSNTTMAKIKITNTATYAWYHFWINNSGSGYQISKGEHFNASYVGQGYW